MQFAARNVFEALLLQNMKQQHGDRVCIMEECIIDVINRRSGKDKT
jgi:hypothetical protein